MSVFEVQCQGFKVVTGKRHIAEAAAEVAKMKPFEGFFDYLESLDEITDLHKHRAAYEYDKPESEVTVEERRKGKNYNSGLIYANSKASDRFHGILYSKCRPTYTSRGPYKTGGIHNIQNAPRPREWVWWKFWTWFRKPPRLTLMADICSGTDHLKYLVPPLMDHDAAEARVAAYLKREAKVAAYLKRRDVNNDE